MNPAPPVTSTAHAVQFAALAARGVVVGASVGAVGVVVVVAAARHGEFGLRTAATSWSEMLAKDEHASGGNSSGVPLGRKPIATVVPSRCR